MTISDNLHFMYKPWKLWQTPCFMKVLNRSMDPRTPNPADPGDIQLPALIHQIPQSHIPSVILPQQIITSGTQKDCIRMRGLPFEASVTDIITFLGEYSRNIVYQGVHMVFNAQVSDITL